MMPSNTGDRPRDLVDNESPEPGPEVGLKGAVGRIQPDQGPGGGGSSEQDRAHPLPLPLRQRAHRMERAVNLDRRHDEALHLIQDTVLYLASLAFADYRARATVPTLGTEELLLRWNHAWFEDY